MPTTWSGWWPIAALLALGCAAPALVQATPGTQSTAAVEFDTDALNSRGLGSDVAEYFKHEARFSAGMNRVTVYVNDRRVGLINTRFDGLGQPCFDAGFLASAGLRAGPPSSEKAPAGCRDFLLQYPNTLVQLHPGRDEIRLIVPTDALRPNTPESRLYATGGAAAILNYDALVVDNQVQGRSSQFRYLQSEVGVNAGDWVLRSRQNYVDSAGQSRFNHLYAYGQKTFVGLGQTVQAGQITIANSIFGGDGLTGVQLVPETALHQGARSGTAPVSGIANSPARIEVRQSGSLIYSTVVPQGPFALTDIPLLNRSSDLDVTVIENNGARHGFVVPASSLTPGQLSGVPGYSIALGQYRAYDAQARTDTPLLATGTGTWTLNDKTRLTAGVMAAANYGAIGWAADRILTPTTRASVRQLASYAKDERLRGTQVSATLSSSLTRGISASLSATMQTAGFRDLGDTVHKDSTNGWFNTRYRMQYSGSLAWSSQTIGSLQGSYSRSSAFDGRQTQFFTGSWSKTFSSMTVSLNLQHGTGQGSAYGNAAMLSLSIPLGPRSVRTYVSQTNHQIRTGASLSDQVGDTVQYDIATEYDSDRKETSVSGNLNLLPRYVQANLGYARSGTSNTTYSGQLRGAVAIHREGITLSPYPINDTFGIAKVGDVAGVKIATPLGPVWTDAGGRAVIPQLAPYQPSRLQVATATLPRNIDLLNGYREIEAGRGTVQHVDFGVATTRRVLLNTATQGQAGLPAGASIMDSTGKYVTTVLNHGKVFLGSTDVPQPLRAELPNGQQCELSFHLNEKQDLNTYYETTDAICRQGT